MPDQPTAADAETTFDVDAWITDARPPQRAVTIYGRGDLLSALQELANQADGPGDDQRLGGNPRLRRMAGLREQIQASARTLHVRGLLNAERQDLLVKHGGGPDQPDEALDGLGYEVDGLVLAAVTPKFTADQARKLHAAVGEAQWAEIWKAINAATLEPIDVPLSRLGSGTTPDS